jgi:hypothetical protein
MRGAQVKMGPGMIATAVKKSFQPEHCLFGIRFNKNKGGTRRRPRTVGIATEKSVKGKTWLTGGMPP